MKEVLVTFVVHMTRYYYILLLCNLIKPIYLPGNESDKYTRSKNISCLGLSLKLIVELGLTGSAARFMHAT